MDEMLWAWVGRDEGEAGPDPPTHTLCQLVPATFHVPSPASYGPPGAGPSATLHMPFPGVVSRGLWELSSGTERTHPPSLLSSHPHIRLVETHLLSSGPCPSLSNPHNEETTLLISPLAPLPRLPGSKPHSFLTPLLSHHPPQLPSPQPGQQPPLPGPFPPVALTLGPRWLLGSQFSRQSWGGRR